MRTRGRRLVTLAALAWCCLLAAGPSALAAPADLDPSFGDVGEVILDPIGDVPLASSFEDVVIDGEDRRIAVGGTFRTVMRRYLPTGELDQSFGTGGEVEIPAIAAANALALEQDGDIVVAGFTDSLFKVAVVRITVGGTVDQGFGNGGLTTVPGFALSDLAVGPSGEIALTGPAPDPVYDEDDFFAARLTPSGQLDETFGGDGTVQTDYGFQGNGTDDQPTGVAIDDQGGLLVSGSVDPCCFYDVFGVVVRFTPTGERDPSFTNAADLGVYKYPDAIALDASGRAVVTGYTYGKVFLARLTSAGALDSSFDGDGVREEQPGAVREYDATEIAIDGNAPVIAGTRNVPDGETEVFVGRFLANGAPDPAFGSSGFRASDIASPGDDAVAGLALAADGDPVVAGSAGSVDFPDYRPPQFLLAEYGQDGELDPGFGTGGVVTGRFTEPSRDAIRELAVDPQGRILAAGTSSLGSVLARFTPAGQLDASFAGGERILLDEVGGYEISFSDGLVIGSGGRLILGVSAYAVTAAGTTTHLGALALTPNGELDTTFGDGGLAVVDPPATNASLAAAPGGGLVLSGNTGSSFGGDDLVVARLTGAGQADPSFGGDGVAEASLTPSDVEAGAVAVQPDGKVVVAGQENDGGFRALAVFRFGVNGDLDPGFAGDGSYVTGITAGDPERPDPTDVLIDADGSLLIGGSVSNYEGGSFGSMGDRDSILVRFNSSGSSYPTISRWDSFGVNQPDGVEDIALEAGGRIVAATQVLGGQQGTFKVSRRRATGFADLRWSGLAAGGFDPAGAGTDSDANAVLVLPDGRILAGGSSDGRIALVALQGGPSSDAPPPDTTITAGPAEGAVLPVNSQPTFEFASTDPLDSFECSLNGGAFVNCGTPYKTQALARRSYELAVRAVSYEGKADPTPASRRFSAAFNEPDDPGPPDTRITKVKVKSKKRSAQFEFEAQGGHGDSGFRCRLDKGQFKSCDSPAVLTRLKPGKHTFEVAADDGFVTDPSPAQQQFKIKKPKKKPKKGKG